MAEYIEVEKARSMSGLRVVLTPGVPGPWSEAAKGILHVKEVGGGLNNVDFKRYAQF